MRAKSFPNYAMNTIFTSELVSRSVMFRYSSGYRGICKAGMGRRPKMAI